MCEIQAGLAHQLGLCTVLRYTGCNIAVFWWHWTTPEGIGGLENDPESRSKPLLAPLRPSAFCVLDSVPQQHAVLCPRPPPKLSFHCDCLALAYTSWRLLAQGSQSPLGRVSSKETEGHASPLGRLRTDASTVPCLLVVSAERW